MICRRRRPRAIASAFPNTPVPLLAGAHVSASDPTPAGTEGTLNLRDDEVKEHECAEGAGVDGDPLCDRAVCVVGLRPKELTH